MSGVQMPEDQVVVLFGATGDLARRKLLPGLFHLAEAGFLPERYRVVATARNELTHREFRSFAHEAVREFGRREARGDGWAGFSDRLRYVPSGDDDGSALADAVERAEQEIGTRRRLHYLAVPPAAFPGIVRLLGETGLAEDARVVVEKPFGTDLASARALNAVAHELFDESRIFRIDHFLGKETVQNILALRFANGIFEPVWNRSHVDHVQIDVPETLSIGARAGFYETTGAFRDMVVTHLFQVLGFVAMEPPASFEAKALVDETVKVFDSMSPVDPARVVRGQYGSYRREPGVAPDSQTETFAALEVAIENWRWAGVPFYLRTGKRLAQGRRCLTVAFREPPHRLFPGRDVSLGPNELVFDLGEPGSITSTFLAKKPGPAMELGCGEMTFRYDGSFATAHQLEAYERLIHDAMVGDGTLFTRADGIERLWEVAAPALESPPPVERYPDGSWGPASMHDLIAPRRWHLPG